MAANPTLETVRIDGDGFHARRKPPAIQNAVWQPLSNSDWVPIDPMGMTGEAGVSQRWMGLPWVAVPKDDWTIDGRTFPIFTARPNRPFSSSTSSRTSRQRERSVGGASVRLFAFRYTRVV